MVIFEFIIDGPPISQEARSRERLHTWRDVVRRRAEAYWPEDAPTASGPLQLTITYYYEDVPAESGDIIEPILDGLTGLVHRDHAQFLEARVTKQDLNSSFRIPSLSPALADGLTRGHEFLHIQIEEISI